MDVPEHWVKGQLLDVRKYTDGTFRVKLLYDKKDAPYLEFENSEAANQFVSRWYTPDARS